MKKKTKILFTSFTLPIMATPLVAVSCGKDSTKEAKKELDALLKTRDTEVLKYKDAIYAPIKKELIVAFEKARSASDTTDPKQQTAKAYLAAKKELQEAIAKAAKDKETLGSIDDVIAAEKVFKIENKEGVIVVKGFKDPAMRNTIETITIPDYVNSIYAQAFQDCPKLTSVFAKNVTNVHHNAFKNCPLLKSVDLPETTEIDMFCFEDDVALEDFNAPKLRYMGHDILKNTKIKNDLVFNGGYKIYKNILFDIDDSISGELIVPDNIRIIYENFAKENTKITKAIMTSVVFIGKNSFYGSKELQEVRLDNLEYIGSYVLTNTKIKNLNLPKVKKISRHALEDNTSLIELNASLVETAELSSVSYCTSLAKIDMPNLKYLGTNSFKNAKFIEDLAPVNGLKIDKGILWAVDSSVAGEIVLKDDVTIIAADVFLNNDKIIKIKMPKVRIVNSYAFDNANKLTDVSMPEVTYLSECCFRNTTSLTNVAMPSKDLVQIAESAFKNSNFTPV